MRPCATCSHPSRHEIDRKLKSGATIIDVARWLATTDNPVGRNALARHSRDHLIGTSRRPGPRAVSDDFLRAVVDDAADGLASGDLRATIKDGIGAQRAIDARTARFQDRDLMLKIAQALGGGSPAPRQLTPEAVILEGEFRELLAGGVGLPDVPPVAATDKDAIRRR